VDDEHVEVSAVRVSEQCQSTSFNNTMLWLTTVDTKWEGIKIKQGHNAAQEQERIFVNK
jgi:hypothetical protein